MKTSSTFQGSGISETYIVKMAHPEPLRSTCILLFSVWLCSGSAQAVAAPASGKAAARKMMIPPPPPHIPLMGGRQDAAMEFSTIGVPLDFMTGPDLERMKKRLEQNNLQMGKKAADRTSSIEECRARVVQFESLYTEGVVSKKDLKTAKKELQDAEDTDGDIDQRLADVQTDLARVNKRLKALEGEHAKAAANTASKPLAAKPAKAAANSASKPLAAKPGKPMPSPSSGQDFLKSVKSAGSKAVEKDDKQPE